MKPVFENVFHKNEHVIKAGKYQTPYFKSPFHYHPEYEITYIVKSEGTMYIGDKTFPFEKGELTFIGPSIPHAWINSKEYYSGDKKACAIVIQFSKELFSDSNLRTREFFTLNKMLKNSNKCLKVKSINSRCLRLLNEISKSDIEKRYILLVQLLTDMASVNHYDFLLDEFDTPEHLNKKYEQLLIYIYNNFYDITLDKLSEHMGMNKSALCRYIKKQANITFSDLVNQIRIKNACILLRETDLSIIHITFDTGYSSTSYFIRTFKKIVGKSPGEYRKEHNLN